MRLSYSKLHTYSQCPLRYRFTYLDRLPRRPRRLFRAARRVHHALMRWLVYSRSGSPRWEDVQAAYDSAWGALQDPAIADSRDYQEGLQILRDYHETNLDRPCQPVFLEHKFSVPIGPHTLAGAIDRVDATETGYEVIDYKLDRELRPQEVVDADLQLGLYHLAMEEAHGISPESLTLYFLRHNLQRTTRRSPRQVSELAGWVVEIGDRISSERQWTPCAGDHCGHCDFRSICPVHTGEPAPPLPSRPARLDAQMSLVLPDAPERPEPEGEPGSQLALPIL